MRTLMPPKVRVRQYATPVSPLCSVGSSADQSVVTKLNPDICMLRVSNISLIKESEVKASQHNSNKTAVLPLRAPLSQRELAPLPFCSHNDLWYEFYVLPTNDDQVSRHKYKFETKFMKILMSPIFQSMVILASLTWYATAEEVVYHYEPQEVELSGTLTERIFYGPPGYGEDPKHDTKEQATVLKLEGPITVIPEGRDATNERHDNVSEVQVVNMKHLPLAALFEKKVKVSGTLFSAITGHHHTDVLINAEEISPYSDSSSASTDSPENIVSNLYRDFPPDGKEAVHWQKKDVLAKYFDNNLVDLFLKEQECSERDKGICNIDFMILYDAQDYQITEFHIDAFDPVKKVVNVRFKNYNKPTLIVYQMSETPAGWRISDIRYEKGHSLVETLKQ